MDDVWAVTSSGRIDHWDGSAWTLRFSGDGAGRGARGIAFDREHAFVLRPRVDSPVPAPLLELRNGEWAPVAFDFGPRARLSDVWGTGPNDVWVAGSDSDAVTPLRSKVWHFDGATWTLVHEELGRSAVALLGAQDSVWLLDSANGKSRVLSWSGSTFVPVHDLEQLQLRRHGRWNGAGALGRALAARVPGVEDPTGAFRRYELGDGSSSAGG